MWLSFSNSASVCSSALLCACISHLSVHSIRFTFQPSLLLPASIERSCLTVDLGRFNVGTWGSQAHSTAAWHSACNDIPLQWEQPLVAGSGAGADTRQSWPRSFTGRNQASFLWRPYKQMQPLALLHKTGQPKSWYLQDEQIWSFPLLQSWLLLHCTSLLQCGVSRGRSDQSSEKRYCGVTGKTTSPGGICML